jgi:hypothetical protein
MRKLQWTNVFAQINVLAPKVSLYVPRKMYRIHKLFGQKPRELAEWWESLTANAEVATVLGLIPASSDTVESESGRWSNIE